MDPARRRWIEWALRAFPPDFRARFGAEMADHARARLDRGETNPVGVIWQLTWAGLAERAHALRRGARERSWDDDPSARGAGGDKTKEGRMTMGLRDTLQEIRFAARALWKRKGYATIAVVTVALGIGANTAIFSVIDGVLLRPLPFEDPDRLILIGSVEEDAYGILGTVAHPEVEAMEGLASLGSVAAVRGERLTLTGDGPAETVVGARVTRGLMRTFRVSPHLGRDLTAEEAVDPDRAVIVLSHAFWRQRLGSDPEAVGRTLTLDNVAYEVVGVAPPDWRYPDAASFWIPGGTVEGDCWWGCSLFSAVARLAPGSTMERAEEELRSLAARLEEEQPRSQTGRSFSVRSLHDDLVGDVRSALWLILGAVGVVLLIACANVAHLLLARGTSRRGEFAVRRAIGASRRRIVLAVLAEGGLIATVGGAVGVVLAWGSLRMLPILSDGSIPRIEEITLDGGVLAFAAALVVASTVAFGLGPGLVATREAGLAGEVRRSGRGGIAGSPGRTLLLTVEVALSVVLLVGAGLLLRTFGALVADDPGFRTAEITRFDLSLPERGYEEAEQVRQFVAGLERDLSALPGVDVVGIAVGAPLTDYSIGGSPRFTDRPEPPPGEGPSAAIRVATPGHFAVYGFDLVAGRFFDEGDRWGSPTAYVVNETFVDRYFAPGDDPLGEPLQMSLSFGYGRAPGRIVGVVRDVSTVGPGWEIEPELYIPHAQLVSAFFTVSMATSGPGPSRTQIAAAVAGLDPDIPFFRLGRIEEAMGSERAPTRFYLALVGSFALLAVTLAAVGLYGVVAYTVARRTREIGVRVALGADRGGIARLILRQGLAPTLVGLAVGMVIAAGSVRLLRSILFGVEPLDAATFTAVPALLLLVSVVAILVPARRAARVAPTEALRGE